MNTLKANFIPQWFLLHAGAVLLAWQYERVQKGELVSLCCSLLSDSVCVLLAFQLHFNTDVRAKD